MWEPPPYKTIACEYTHEKLLNFLLRTKDLFTENQMTPLCGHND